MKKILLIGFCITLSLCTYSQERQDETRQKLEIKAESQSELLTRVLGWSQIETSEGKVWKKSDKPNFAYLPNHDLAISFYSLQTVKFSIDGKGFYLLCIHRPIFKEYEDENGNNQYGEAIDMNVNSYVDYFAFSGSSFERLKSILKRSDGNYYSMIDVKYCKSGQTEEGYYFPEIDIKDKNMIRQLLTGQGYIGPIPTNCNDCQEDSLFSINSQVIKGDTIIRFNVLSRKNGEIWREAKSLSQKDSYFEVSKHDFNCLFNFSPFITKEMKLITKEQNHDIASKKYDKYIDSLNQKSYFNLDHYYRLEKKPILISFNKDYTELMDSSINKANFNIIVNSEGKVISSPNNINLFKNLSFSPATVKMEYLPGLFKEYKVNSEVPVKLYQKSYSGSYGETTDPKIDIIIVKLKKSKTGIEVLAQKYNRKEFYDDAFSTINLEKEFSTYDSGKYYFYFERKSTKWIIDIFGDAGYFYHNIDKKTIKVFDSNNPDSRCP